MSCMKYVAATALLPWSQRFFFLFFFVKERAREPRSGDNEEKISELQKTETRVGSEGLQTVRNLRNDGDDRTSAKFPNLVELYHS